MVIDRSSPYSESVVDFVARNPGCCKFDLAKHLTWHPQRPPSKQYYLVNTQIRLGNIVAEKQGNRYALHVNPELELA